MTNHDQFNRQGAMSGQPPLERQWVILRTLTARRYGATVEELAKDHCVSRKTIRRDLILLRDLGFPLAPRNGPHGRHHWVCQFDASVPPLSFDVSEILALYLGRRLLEPFAGTLIWEAQQSLFRKIKATLGEPALDYLDQLARLIHRTSFRDSNYQDKSEAIDQLMIAIEDRRMTFITYQSARSTEPLTYDVYPYGVIYHRGSLYLVAHSQQHGEIRTFKVDRISAVSLEKLTFQKPVSFNLDEHLRNSLGVFHSDGHPRQALIRFAADVAMYVQEHHWHESQQIARQRDGSLLVEFQLADFTELKSWILSFGSKATVEAPSELREAIAEEITILAQRYQQSRNSQPRKQHSRNS